MSRKTLSLYTIMLYRVIYCTSAVLIMQWPLRHAPHRVLHHIRVVGSFLVLAAQKKLRTLVQIGPLYKAGPLVQRKGCTYKGKEGPLQSRAPCTKRGSANQRPLYKLGTHHGKCWISMEKRSFLQIRLNEGLGLRFVWYLEHLGVPMNLRPNLSLH